MDACRYNGTSFSHAPYVPLALPCLSLPEKSGQGLACEGLPCLRLRDDGIACGLVASVMRVLSWGSKWVMMMMSRHSQLQMIRDGCDWDDSSHVWCSHTPAIYHTVTGSVGSNLSLFIIVFFSFYAYSTYIRVCVCHSKAIVCKACGYCQWAAIRFTIKLDYDPRSLW